MSIILNIETATKNCSVSIASKGRVIAVKELNNGNYSHAEVLHPFIENVLKESQLTIKNIDAVAVSKGPGSYTGLRIGVSAAKGLCFANNIPLISIDTLQSLANAISISEGCIIPMIDARRMEVYSDVFSIQNQSLRGIKAEIVTDNTYLNYLNKGLVTFLGDGALKCKPVIKHKNAKFIDGKFPSSEQMAFLSYEKYVNNTFEDVAYFEPFYLKDFIAVPQKKT
ncbi:tRNA (adenosine(37)-N6)-threonylcarbamoyltransferase complex dimerization subunit type 1 TsaB [Polaribacter sp.]|uniref:tRNA (adenosine(37)-N6)-threonylcarbamoyltransferase complex dimerization subunit type 1 TsaB n=1 Tax=Polaribacter sp. TaxID=1920175 RepID=UPI0025FAA8F0|nr:tRNA (adenosine(37)-N6)-threonylcarbamoyltransferase complex dimerization subunit type 1 TsaB [Polaribacter sp.]